MEPLTLLAERLAVRVVSRPTPPQVPAVATPPLTRSTFHRIEESRHSNTRREPRAEGSRRSAVSWTVVGQTQCEAVRPKTQPCSVRLRSRTHTCTRFPWFSSEGAASCQASARGAPRCEATADRRARVQHRLHCSQVYSDFKSLLTDTVHVLYLRPNRAHFEFSSHFGSSRQPGTGYRGSR